MRNRMACAKGYTKSVEIAAAEADGDTSLSAGVFGGVQSGLPHETREVPVRES